MKLNKKEKNYLLSTLFKGYVIQCAICSVLIFGGTFLLGIMAEEILRKYVLYYYLYYRTEYLYIMKKFKKIARDLYSYYGVTEEDIINKTERYSSLVTSLSS